MLVFQSELGINDRYFGHVYSPTGESILSFGEQGVALGQMGEYRGMEEFYGSVRSLNIRPFASFGPKNEIIISDPANYRIQILTPVNP